MEIVEWFMDGFKGWVLRDGLLRDVLLRMGF